MNENAQRIHKLLGRLSEAIWDKVTRDQDHWAELLLEKSLPYGEPQTPEEIEVWNELTDPRNHEAFLDYLDSHKVVELSEYALRLYSAIQTEMQRRMKNESSR